MVEAAEGLSETGEPLVFILKCAHVGGEIGDFVDNAALQTVCDT